MEQISTTSWALAYLSIFLLGVSKAGLKGLSIFNVTLLALAFGAKTSTGILMPLLLIGDVFAVIYYNRHAHWSYIKRFLPYMLIGILIGLFTGHNLNEAYFKVGMVIVIFLSLATLLLWERKPGNALPTHWTFGGVIGVLAGICTMIGNLAGAFTNIYFLALKLPKKEFVGTAAWLFLITNSVKLPLHIFVWQTISYQSFLINLKLLPAIFMGLLVGLYGVQKIGEKQYKKFILLVTALGAIAILFK